MSFIRSNFFFFFFLSLIRFSSSLRVSYTVIAAKSRSTKSRPQEATSRPSVIGFCQYLWSIIDRVDVLVRKWKKNSIILFFLCDNYFIKIKKKKNNFLTFLVRFIKMSKGWIGESRWFSYVEKEKRIFCRGVDRRKLDARERTKITGRIVVTIIVQI